MFVVRSKCRDQLREALAADGIATGIHYPSALPHLLAYADHPQHRDEFRASAMADEVLSLPIGDSIDSVQVDKVIGAVNSFFCHD